MKVFGQVCVCVRVQIPSKPTWQHGCCTLFHVDGIPQDGSPIDVIRRIPWLVTISLYFFSIVGILFTLVCLGFNIIFRKRK